MSEPSRPPPPLVAWWIRFREWPAWGRWSAYVAAGVVLVLLALTATAVVVVRRPLPTTDGELDLPGLEAPVEVLRDAHGIPQLYGESVDDLLTAQGYVHAQERFYEMDVRRHITAGRLSELFGEATLETDAMVRTMGWRRVAERELALVSSTTRNALTAYADGVNAYLDQNEPSQIAVQYTVLGASGLDYRPEPWTPVDSLAWLKAMAWDLRGNLDEEIARATSGLDHTPEQVEELFPRYPYGRNAPILDGGGLVDGVFEPDATGDATRLPRPPPFGDPSAADEARRLVADVGEALDAMPALLGRGDDLGSNSWVVSGDRSSTGSPLLANDPHLGTGLPGVWMQMGLHCTEVTEDCPLEVSGFGFSGVPGVVIGHNADIAWGFTNLGPDVTDLYLEQADADTWLFDGQRRPLRLREETIEVRDGDDVELTVRSTDNGPILSDVSEQLREIGEDAVAPGGTPGVDTRPDTGGYAVSLAWTALDPAPTADALLGLNLASDWDEFRAAAADFAVPAQNLTYADREGHIGYQAPGRVPIRRSGNDGSQPAAGWLPENAWTGDYVPFESLPHELDPDEGYVVTANQAVTGPDYPIYLTDDWDRGYRSQRIRDGIEAELATGDLSVAEMAELQLDERQPLAPRLVPFLLDVELPDGYPSEGQELLADWDFDQPADSAPAAYFNTVWSRLLELTFHDELEPAARPDGADRWIAVVERLLRRPASPWWDDVTTEDVETRDDVLRAALLDARDELTATQSPVPEEWEWGAMHTLDLAEPTLGTSGVGLVERLVNRGGWEVGGGSEVVNAFGWDAREGYGALTGPSMRMVVSTADWDDSRWVNLTGVSGHPASDHYVDQTDLMVGGETLPWAWSPDAVRAATDDTLTLRPAPDD